MARVRSRSSAARLGPAFRRPFLAAVFVVEQRLRRRDGQVVPADERGQPEAFGRGRLAPGRDRPQVVFVVVACRSITGTNWLVANRPVPWMVYGRVLTPSIPRSTHGRRGHRFPLANRTPTTWRSHSVTTLRAAPAREDSASQGRFRESRELARLARPQRATRAGLCPGGAPRLSRVRAPLLRLRPRGLHDVPHGIRRGISRSRKRSIGGFVFAMATRGSRRS